MKHGQRVSLILPSRDEGQGLLKMILQVPSTVDEIIVVNNRSKVSPKRLLSTVKRVKVVNETRVDNLGIGYGYAIQTGLQVAKGDIVISMDGDGTYPVNVLNELIDLLVVEKLDIAFCSRFPLDTEKSISWFRRLGVWILNTEAKLLFNYEGSDILSGMWAAKRVTVDLLDLREGGWNFSPEIKLAVLEKNKLLKSRELHIDHYVRDYGKSKQVLWKTGIDHLLYMIRRWLKLENFRYEEIV